MSCQCSGAGFCARHGLFKPEPWRQLCSTNPDYFEAWEGGYGPGQNRSKIAPEDRVYQGVEESGPEIWFSLHTYTQDGVWDAGEAERWYRNVWLPTVPNYGCRCRKHWGKIASRNPPDFSTEEAFFLWGVGRHNDVNRKLGKGEYATTLAREDRKMRLGVNENRVERKST